MNEHSRRTGSPTEQATRWLESLGGALERGDIAAATGLFAAECFWRDYLAFTWNIKTLEGRDAIAAMLTATLGNARPSRWRLDGEASEAGGVVEAFITFETATGRGRGHLRLKGGEGYTLLTTLAALKGFEEKIGPTREKGIEHRPARGRKFWTEERAAEEAALGTTEMPYTVIVGGGQGGIALAARLKVLGVPTIILETHAKPGDSWRSRYRSLVLHDPVWYDHLPYIPFPDHWPVFTPKDQLGDWLEMYVKVMGLHFWGSTKCESARFDEGSQEWVLEIDRAGTKQTLRCQQLVFCTGSYGPPNEISVPGAESFAGEQYHSSRYQSGEHYAGKKCVVIGSNSSAHDIAVDLWECGAEVTMHQRAPTTVVRSETLMELAMGPLYSEEALARGITTDKADLLFMSLPFRLLAEEHVKISREIAKVDADFYTRLAASGFQHDFGPDGSGLTLRAWRTGSGYYIDVGGSDLIAKGEIKLKSGGEIREIKPNSIVFSDGIELPADLIVFATGYQTMDRGVAAIAGEDVARRLGRSFGYGSGVAGDPGPWDGEVRNLWKPTAVPALWVHGGNLHLARQNSLYVALQLKARMEGIPTPVYGGPVAS